MNRLSPPRLAVMLLSRFGPRDEVLAGDLVEEFESGRSRWWFWQQVLAAVASEARRQDRDIRPLRLVEDESADGTIGIGDRTKRLDTRRPVNITASPLAGVGGLSVVILAVLLTTVVPQVWWILAGAASAGLAAGVLMLVRNQHRMNGRPSTAAPTLLVRDSRATRPSLRSIDRDQ